LDNVRGARFRCLLEHVRLAQRFLHTVLQLARVEPLL
jgi:hypothetical protein